jgi:hypothetical protein
VLAFAVWEGVFAGVGVLVSIAIPYWILYRVFGNDEDG